MPLGLEDRCGVVVVVVVMKADAVEAVFGLGVAHALRTKVAKPHTRVHRRILDFLDQRQSVVQRDEGCHSLSRLKSAAN